MENGKTFPSHSVTEFILQKLGEDSQDTLAFFRDSDERQGHQIYSQLKYHHIQGNRDEMSKLIKEAEKTKYFESGVNLQFLLFCKTEVDKTLSLEDRLGKLLEALRLTEKNFIPEEIGKSVYAYSEIIVIAGIADAYHRMKDYEKAVQIMYGLKESLDVGYINDWEKARVYPAVLFNLSVYLGALERNDEM